MPYSYYQDLKFKIQEFYPFHEHIICPKVIILQIVRGMLQPIINLYIMTVGPAVCRTSETHFSLKGMVSTKVHQKKYASYYHL